MRFPSDQAGSFRGAESGTLQQCARLSGLSPNRPPARPPARSLGAVSYGAANNRLLLALIHRH